MTGGRERAEALARGLGTARMNRVLPRWGERLCVRMIGMQPEAARQFEARVLRVAQDAGVRVGEPGCDPNLVVAFTIDGQATARHIYRRRPMLFMNRPVIERERFVEGDDPVRWWVMTNAEGPDGRLPAGSAGDAGLTFEGSAGMAINAPTVRGGPPTLIGSQGAAIIGGGMVIIDSRRVEGVRLNALADYVAMVTLTGVIMRADYAAAEADTIMGLFSSPAARQAGGMSDADRAYLSRLYAISPHELAWRQRGTLRASVREALLAADDAAVEAGP